MAGHTPGPWVRAEAVCIAPLTGARKAICQFYISNPNVDADMALVAAAPDLLAALIAIRDYARDSRTGRMLTGEGYAMADAAIAKAEAV